MISDKLILPKEAYPEIINVRYNKHKPLLIHGISQPKKEWVRVPAHFPDPRISQPSRAMCPDRKNQLAQPAQAAQAAWNRATVIMQIQSRS